MLVTIFRSLQCTLICTCEKTITKHYSDFMHHQTKTANVMYQCTPFALLSVTTESLGKTQTNIHNFKYLLSVSSPTGFCLIPLWSHHQKSEHHLLSRSHPGHKGKAKLLFLNQIP